MKPTELGNWKHFTTVLVGQKRFPSPPMNFDSKEANEALSVSIREMHTFLEEMRAKCPAGAQLQIHNESDGEFMNISVVLWTPETDEEAAKRLKASEAGGDTSVQF